MKPQGYQAKPNGLLVATISWAHTWACLMILRLIPNVSFSAAIQLAAVLSLCQRSMRVERGYQVREACHAVSVA